MAIFAGIVSISMSSPEPVITKADVPTVHCANPNGDDYITKTYVGGSAVFTYHYTDRSPHLMHVDLEYTIVLDAGDANFKCITWANN